jgi:hypothetical protein
MESACVHVSVQRLGVDILALGDVCTEGLPVYRDRCRLGCGQLQQNYCTSTCESPVYRDRCTPGCGQLQYNFCTSTREPPVYSVYEHLVPPTSGLYTVDIPLY